MKLSNALQGVEQHFDEIESISARTEGDSVIVRVVIGERITADEVMEVDMGADFIMSDDPAFLPGGSLEFSGFYDPSEEE